MRCSPEGLANLPSTLSVLLTTGAFWGLHLAALAGVLLLGWSWSGFALALALYYLRMFFVTGGYHRYFSHRAFKTSRWFQLVLAFGAQTSAQKGVLWWAARHREHHKYSDTPRDLHSPRQRGFWWAHVGWIMSDAHEGYDPEAVGDLERYPELRALTRWQFAPAVALAVACAGLGGLHGLLWGFAVSTVLLWHGTFTINSLSHVIGRRRFETRDDSRNNAVLALLTMGEGWHNNHHHYQSSARQGFYWWEIDATYYVLRALAAVGIVWDLRPVPRRLYAQVKGAEVGDGAELPALRDAA